MRWLDRFFDSYEKRINVIFLLFLLSLFIVSCRNFSLAQQLLYFDSLNDFYAILRSTVADNTFFAALIRVLLDYNFSFAAIGAFFSKVMNIPIYLLLGTSFLLLTADELPKNIRRIIIAFLMTMLLMYLAAFLLAVFSLNTINIDHVVSNMKLIGIIFTVASLFHILLCLLGLCHLLIMSIYKSGK